ncbi:MAG TPA: hypothetical protein VGA56_14140 [Opitutaceae bacterium]
MLGSCLMPTKQKDPEVERKARRAVVILYLVMFAGMAIPVVLWWWKTW